MWEVCIVKSWTRPTTALQPSCKLIGPQDIVQFGVIVHAVHEVGEVVAVKVGEVHLASPVVHWCHVDNACWCRVLHKVCVREKMMYCTCLVAVKPRIKFLLCKWTLYLRHKQKYLFYSLVKRLKQNKNVIFSTIKLLTQWITNVHILESPFPTLQFEMRMHKIHQLSHTSTYVPKCSSKNMYQMYHLNQRLTGSIPLTCFPFTFHMEINQEKPVSGRSINLYLETGLETL